MSIINSSFWLVLLLFKRNYSRVSIFILLCRQAAASAWVFIGIFYGRGKRSWKIAWFMVNFFHAFSFSRFSFYWNCTGFITTKSLVVFIVQVSLDSPCIALDALPSEENILPSEIAYNCEPIRHFILPVKSCLRCVNWTVSCFRCVVRLHFLSFFTPQSAANVVKKYWHHQ